MNGGVLSFQEYKHLVNTVAEVLGRQREIR